MLIACGLRNDSRYAIQYVASSPGAFNLHLYVETQKKDAAGVEKTPHSSRGEPLVSLTVSRELKNWMVSHYTLERWRAK